MQKRKKAVFLLILPVVFLLAAGLVFLRWHAAGSRKKPFFLAPGFAGSSNKTTRLSHGFSDIKSRGFQKKPRLIILLSSIGNTICADTSSRNQPAISRETISSFFTCKFLILSLFVMSLSPFFFI